MKTSKRIVVYMQVMMAAMMLMFIFGAHIVHAMTDQEKNSSYGFFVWLSENQNLSDADRKDAAVAAQLLKGEVSSEYRTQVFNKGNISTPDDSNPVDYETVRAMTTIGGENDATDLKRVKDAIEYIILGNSYRAKEKLDPLKVSSALMAMSELNANYQFSTGYLQIDHTLAFNALENLSTYTGGSSGSPQVYYDPYNGWYTEEKEYYDNNELSKAGHYMTLTDRKGKMLLTGFGFTYAFTYETRYDKLLNWVDEYCSQHFSDDSSFCSIGDGITPDEYLTYLDRYECSLEGHEIDTTIATVTKEATCLEDGLQTGPCKKCGETVEEVIPKLGHKMQKTDMKAATCTEDGNKEYYTCSRCEKLFFDEAGEMETTQADLVVPAPGHDMQKTEAKAETCAEDGNIEYYTCKVCKKLFKDAAGTEEITQEDTIKIALGHDPKKVEAKEATCSEAGNIEHYACSRCEKLFSDEEGKTEIAKEDTVVVVDHELETMQAKPATCTEQGNIEYFTCKVCKKIFSDQTGKNEITEADTVIAKSAHIWSDWTVITPATTASEGVQEHTCTVCGEKEICGIARLPETETVAADGTAIGAGASASLAEAAITSSASEEGPAGSTFVRLSAKAKKVNKTSVTLTWNNVAPGYIIFGNKCGQRFNKIAVVNGTSFTQSGLEKGTYYKYMVVALDGSGKVVAASRTIHVATSGKKVSNPKKVTVKKKTLKVNQGKTAKIKASIVKPNGKKVKNHRKLAYESADPAIATVTKSGKVKGISKGTTFVYVYAQNGVFAKVKIIVK